MTSIEFVEWLKKHKKKPKTINEMRLLYAIARQETELEKQLYGEKKMTKEELKQLKELLNKADKAITHKHMKCFYEERDITGTQSSYLIFRDVIQLKIKLDIGIYDEYLLNDESQTKNLH